MSKVYFYIKVPKEELKVEHEVTFMPISELVYDSPENYRRCEQIFDLLTNNFRTRRKFLELWPHVKYVAFIEEDSEIVSCAFASTPMNWQIDYVVTRPDKRGRGMAKAVTDTLTNEARKRRVPYVMLTSVPELLNLYGYQCGYTVVGSNDGDISVHGVMESYK